MRRRVSGCGSRRDCRSSSVANSAARAVGAWWAVGCWPWCFGESPMCCTCATSTLGRGESGPATLTRGICAGWAACVSGGTNACATSGRGVRTPSEHRRHHGRLAAVSPPGRFRPWSTSGAAGSASRIGVTVTVAAGGTVTATSSRGRGGGGVVFGFAIRGIVPAAAGQPLGNLARRRASSPRPRRPRIWL